MKTRELRDKNKQELENILEEKRECVRKLRFDVALRQIKKTRDIRNAKKDIARILTLLRTHQ